MNEYKKQEELDTKTSHKGQKQSSNKSKVQINREQTEAKMINIPHRRQETLEDTQGTWRGTSHKTNWQGVQGEQKLNTQTLTRGSGTGEEGEEGWPD